MKAEFYLKRIKPVHGSDKARVQENFDFHIDASGVSPAKGQDTKATADDRKHYPKQYSDFARALQAFGAEKAVKFARATGEWRPGETLMELKEAEKAAKEKAAEKVTEPEADSADGELEEKEDE